MNSGSKLTPPVSRTAGGQAFGPSDVANRPSLPIGLVHIPPSLAEETRILALLHEIGKELTSILDPEKLLRVVGERVKQLVDYDLFNVMLLNAETQRLQHAFSLKYDQRVHSQQTLALGEGLCGNSALERKPIRVNRVSTDPRYVMCEIGLKVESELVVPLIVQDRVLGVLDLECLKPNAFTVEHEQLLSTLASTIAIALENARLYDQLRRAKQRVKEDLERAREVQLLLLPGKTPEIPGVDIAVHYQPAQELGGDFYDFLHYADGRLAIAVGDVAGKGAAAALLATLGVGILREHAIHSPSMPADMLADLNGHLQVPGNNGRFIALAYSVYDPVARELVVANAGFPQPILVRGGQARAVNVAGVPLGLFPDSTYEPVRMALEADDFIVFCSDGIHEQTNSHGEEFGILRLLAQLAGTGVGVTAQEVAGNVSRAIDEHAHDGGCAKPMDDRTIVVLRIVQP